MTEPPSRPVWPWVALAGALLLAVAGLAVWALWPAAATSDSSTATAPGATGPAATPPPDEPAPATDAPYELTGRVLDEQGLPVAGAKVWAERQAEEPKESCPVCQAYVGTCFDRTTAPRFFAELVAHRAVRAAEQQSGPDGEFRFQGLQGDVRLGAALGDAFADGTRSEYVDLPDGGSELVLTLRPARQFVLAVTHEDEAPFADAVVQVHHRGLGRTLTGRTDRAGRYVTQLQPGEVYVLVDAPGHLTALVSGQSDEASGEDTPPGVPNLNVTLTRERRLVVKTQASGRPVDADVFVGPARDAATGSRAPHTLALRTVGGRLVVDHLWADTVLVEAHAGPLVAQPTRVFIEDEQEVTLELLASSSLGVTVVDEGGDASAAEVSVSLSSGGGTLDLSGPMHQRFEFGPIPEGEYDLFVQASDARPVRRRVDLRPGPNSLEVTLRRQLFVAGRVETSTGAPVEGAHVQVAELGLSLEGLSSTASDEDGGFLLEVPEPGRFEVSVWHPEHGNALAPLETGGAPATIRLMPGATLEVTVRDEAGHPVPQAQVRCDAAAFGFAVREAGADGRARVLGLGGQDVELWVSAEGFSDTSLRVAVAAAGTTRQAVMLVREGVIRGRLVDAAGRPAEGYALCDGSPCNEVPSESGDGQFAVRWPHGKSVQLAASGLEGGEPGPAVTVRAPAEGVRLVVPTPRQVHGRVVTKDGAALRRFEVGGRTFTAADGRFTAPAVSPELDVQAEGFAMQSVPVPAKGDDVGVVTLEPLPFIRGVVLGEHGPVAGATVNCMAFEGASVQTRADGRFEARVLPADELVLNVTRGAQSARATAKPGDDVVLRLSPGVRVEGLVLGPDGKPAAAEVSALPQSEFGQGSTASAGADGRFTLTLPEGLYAFATRATGAALVQELRAPTAQVVLSVAADRCRLTVSGDGPLDLATLVPGSLPAGAPPELSVSPGAGAVLLARGSDGRTFRGQGLPCGLHTLLWCAAGRCGSQAVDLSRQHELHVAPPPDDGAPAGEHLAPSRLPSE